MLFQEEALVSEVHRPRIELLVCTCKICVVGFVPDVFRIALDMCVRSVSNCFGICFESFLDVFRYVYLCRTCCDTRLPNMAISPFRRGRVMAIYYLRVYTM